MTADPFVARAFLLVFVSCSIKYYVLELKTPFPAVFKFHNLSLHNFTINFRSSVFFFFLFRTLNGQRVSIQLEVVMFNT